MKKITYLFGAGASRGALPIIADIPSQLELFKEELKNAELPRPNDNIDSLLTELEWLIEQASSAKNRSIDLLAKRLWLESPRNPLFRKLKLALTLFLIYCQIKNDPDPRYDIFFNHLLDGTMKLPSHIKVVSWNYDSQFEIAIRPILKNRTSVQSVLNVHTKNVLESCSREDVFSIYKINGTASFSTEPLGAFDFYEDTTMSELFSQLVEWYGDSQKKYKKHRMTLSFAWEQEDIGRGQNEGARRVTNLCLDGIKETDVLVVIGYSFPDFNRSLDKEILRGMKNLEKIYIQDMYPDSVKNNFSSVGHPNNPQIVLDDRINKFLLPLELDY